MSRLCNNVRETQIRDKSDGSNSSYWFRIILKYFLGDIVALRTGLGPVVIIDVRKMPETATYERCLNCTKDAWTAGTTICVDFTQYSSVLLTAIVSNFIDIFVILFQITISCRTYLFLFVYEFNFISYMLISTKV